MRIASWKHVDDAICGRCTGDEIEVFTYLLEGEGGEEGDPLRCLTCGERGCCLIVSGEPDQHLWECEEGPLLGSGDGGGDDMESELEDGGSECDWYD